MGPRSIDRGTQFSMILHFEESYELQWGRDQLIAELLGDGESTTARRKLQWGRDQLIAELRRRGHVGLCGRARFNGAAIN